MSILIYRNEENMEFYDFITYHFYGKLYIKINIVLKLDESIRRISKLIVYIFSEDEYNVYYTLYRALRTKLSKLERTGFLRSDDNIYNKDRLKEVCDYYIQQYDLISQSEGFNSDEIYIIDFLRCNKKVYDLLNIIKRILIIEEYKKSITYIRQKYIVINNNIIKIFF